jgi:hypothetical protein
MFFLIGVKNIKKICYRSNDTSTGSTFPQYGLNLNI